MQSDRKKEAVCFPETSVPSSRLCGTITQMNKIWTLPRWKPQISQLGVRLQTVGHCNGSEDWQQQSCVTYLIKSAHIIDPYEKLCTIFGIIILKNFVNFCSLTCIFQNAVIHIGDIHEKNVGTNSGAQGKCAVAFLQHATACPNLPTLFIEFRAPTQLSAQEQKTQKTLKLT